MRFRALVAVGVALGLGPTSPAAAVAQVRVSPTGVSVNAMAATTVFLTFGGVGSLTPAEAFWCGDLVPAAPDLGQRCNPATLFGQLPARNDRSRRSGTSAFTDIMSIPPSVARRAYQAAVRGATSTFFYVRRFRNAAGPDQYVVVTCRLTGGGARVPLALTDVRLAFDPPAAVLQLGADDSLPALAAQITYNGTGRLVGRWEVVLPGEELPTETDLLTEATLPLEDRARQRRYTPVERFNVFLPPNGRVTLPGPDPSKFPVDAEGTYLVLLRIEASNDREGDSDLGAVGAGNGVVHRGGVAGFPMPVLRYVVGAGDDGAIAASETASPIRLLTPGEGATIAPDSAVRLRWSGVWGAAGYRVELVTERGDVLLDALLGPRTTHYDPPPLVRSAAGARRVRWRIWALDLAGAVIRRSAWRSLQFTNQRHSHPWDRRNDGPNKSMVTRTAGADVQAGNDRALSDPGHDVVGAHVRPSTTAAADSWWRRRDRVHAHLRRQQSDDRVSVPAWSVDRWDRAAVSTGHRQWHVRRRKRWIPRRRYRRDVRHEELSGRLRRRRRRGAIRLCGRDRPHQLPGMEGRDEKLRNGGGGPVRRRQQPDVAHGPHQLRQRRAAGGGDSRAGRCVRRRGRIYLRRAVIAVHNVTVIAAHDVHDHRRDHAWNTPLHTRSC